MYNLVLLLILLLVYGNVIELKRIVSYWGCFRIGLLRNIKVLFIPNCSKYLLDYLTLTKYFPNLP
jgi:hypothetical protein